MAKKLPKPIDFSCPNCGLHFGKIEHEFIAKCPHCKSSIGMEGNITHCFPPDNPPWIWVVAIFLLLGGIPFLMVYGSSGKEGIYGWILVIVGLLFLYKGYTNKIRYEHAMTLRAKNPNYED